MRDYQPKTYVVAGIETGVYGKSGRDWFGVLPMTGKILNVRNATPTSIAANKVIVSLIQSLGLRHGVDYRSDSNYRTLRYGRVISVCDADCFSNDTPILIRRNNIIDIVAMENVSQKWVQNIGIGILKDTEVWSKGGWTKIIGLRRKESKKRMLEINAYCGIIHCTEDHKMILEDGTEIAAKNLKPGDRIMRTRRIPKVYFDRHTTYTNLKAIAKKHQVYKYSHLSKTTLSQGINEENLFCDPYREAAELRSVYLHTISNNSPIQLEEAWVWGFFFAEGNMWNIYLWK